MAFSRFLSAITIVLGLGHHVFGVMAHLRREDHHHIVRGDLDDQVHQNHNHLLRGKPSLEEDHFQRELDEEDSLFFISDFQLQFGGSSMMSIGDDDGDSDDEQGDPTPSPSQRPTTQKPTLDPTSSPAAMPDTSSPTFSPTEKPTTTTTSPTTGSSSSCQNVVWRDDFASHNNKVDDYIWSYDLGNGENGWGNQELQFYRKENVRVDDDGNLIISVLNNETTENHDGITITSGRINTQDKLEVLYGTIEVRVQIPTIGVGLWPAFWTLGGNFREIGWPNSGEIDILEMGGLWGSDAFYEDSIHRRVTSAIHWFDNDNNNQQITYSDTWDSETPLNDGEYHTFRLEWTSTNISIFGDDNLILDMDISQCGGVSGSSGSCSELHQPHYLLLNVAVGGRFTNIFDPADVTAPLPAEMKVDYVQICDNGETILSGSAIEGPPIEYDFDCGDDDDDAASNSCTTSALNNYAGEVKCGDRIDFLMESMGQSEEEACKQIASIEYPEECGACWASTTTTGTAEVLNDCGVPDTCTDEALAADADGFACGDRINFLMESMGQSELAACNQVAVVEFPSECGDCAPPPGSDTDTGTGIDCGVPDTCTNEALAADADGPSCGDRIAWVMNNMGESETGACYQVAVLEFPTECGKCTPPEDAASWMPSDMPAEVPTMRPTQSTSRTCFPDRATLDTALSSDYANTGIWPYTTYGPISSWCFDPGLTDFSDLFNGATLTEDISAWDVSNVVNFEAMFRNSAFNQNISGWDVSKGAAFTAMFRGNTAFNQDLSSWDVSSATLMAYMFESAPFNQDITGWNVAKVRAMHGMFKDTSFNQDISGWDVSSVNNFYVMFNGATSFNQDLCAWGSRFNTNAGKEIMFQSTACPDPSDPDLAVSPITPLCHACDLAGQAVILDCGVPDTCTSEVLANDADGASCEDRIRWVMDNMGQSGQDACNQVAAIEFPAQCGGCAPPGQSDVLDCGVPDTCTSAVLAADANGSSCGDRIRWVMETMSHLEADACYRVAVVEFPSQCGECAPPATALDCGLPDTCTSEVLAMDADGASCGERISWVMENLGQSEQDACHQVAAIEFPTQCGGCASSLAAPDACDPACPCCRDIEEFVRTIEKFSGTGNSAACQGQDCCLSREDGDIFLIDCESDLQPGYGVAYMSYDYSVAVDDPNRGRFTCGDSAFGDPLWHTISEEEAAICDALVRSKIQNVGACSSEWPCQK